MRRSVGGVGSVIGAGVGVGVGLGGFFGAADADWPTASKKTSAAMKTTDARRPAMTSSRTLSRVSATDTRERAGRMTEL